ncbi:MAG: hypothetical protein V3S16_05895 [Candidatus Desulfatibia sp.]|uniref:hypothetical protein n=1 Tax=Candidatus Desulfatibia sp. TaxID=3101189 RepID=UPI002F32B6AA
MNSEPVNAYHKAFIVVLLLLTACKTNVVVTESSDTSFSMEKLLILPLRDMSAVYGAGVSVRCPVCGSIVMTGEVAEGAMEFLSDSLYSALKNKGDFELVPSGQAQGVLSKLLHGDADTLSERALLVETGQALNADAVLAGYIYRFRERVGTRYAVKSPASVAFDIHLIRVADGRVLWSGQFNETQKSLSEDLLHLETFLKRKASWITAREMAQAGLEDILQSFSGFGIR